MIERPGEAFELDECLTVVGRKLQPGEKAPDFALDYFDSNDSKIYTVQLADSAEMVRLLNVINSLGKPVCQTETLCWHQLGGAVPPGVRIYTVSMDIPFAQARWQESEGVTHQAISAHRGEQFGRDYGVLLKEWGLLQRAVFVIDCNDRIVYADYVADQMREPDYEAAMEAVHQAARLH